MEGPQRQGERFYIRLRTKLDGPRVEKTRQIFKNETVRTLTICWNEIGRYVSRGF